MLFRSREEAEEFLDVLLGESSAAKVGAASGRSGGGTPPPLFTLKQLILEKAQGTPFFMEEIVQDLVEQGVLVRTEVGAVRRDRPFAGAHKGTPPQIPSTVQGILAARIDRLAPEEKALLQQLAVIGRQFPMRVVVRSLANPKTHCIACSPHCNAKNSSTSSPPSRRWSTSSNMR